MVKDTNGSLDISNNASLEELMMHKLFSLPPLSSTCSIYRVPERLRHVNEKAYGPKVVSIGPFHHGRKELEAMEEHKMRYLDDLIDRTHVRLGSYIEVVRLKGELRACYSEAIGFTSNEFVQIILVDAAFIIGFLLRLKFDNMRDETDRIFKKPWMSQDIWLDLLLLENQLPFFILEDVFERGMKILDNDDQHLVDIFELSYSFFNELMYLKVERSQLAQIRSFEIKHFVDFLRHLYLPLNSKDGGELQTITTPSITELHQAGVKFEASSSGNLFDLQFENGCLKIPKLIIGKETEISIRNLLAFEQCYYEDNRVNDYFVIMNRLINTQKDVDLVVKYKIVENRLGNNKDGSFLINKLTDGVILDFNKFSFASLCKELNKYCSNPWHMWIENLRQKYFNTPWAIISFGAAVTILILALIQTVCSIISAKSPSTNGDKP